jgi:hypothetical protein
VPKPPTRWVILRDAIKASSLPASDKAVYRALLDAADYTTAVLLPGFTPAQVKVAAETGLSRRQVQYAERHLELHGWLTVSGSTGPGKRRHYVLRDGGPCHCAGRVHERAQRERPARVERAQPEWPERAQPTGATGATFGHRSGATNGRNAAGQKPLSPVSSTRQEERPMVENPNCSDCGAPISLLRYAQTRANPSGPVCVRCEPEPDGGDDAESADDSVATDPG